MPATTTENHAPWWRRAIWFAGLWLAGVSAVGAVAYGLRILIKAVG
jgi:hypothetical protein